MMVCDLFVYMTAPRPLLVTTKESLSVSLVNIVIKYNLTVLRHFELECHLYSFSLLLLPVTIECVTMN